MTRLFPIPRDTVASLLSEPTWHHELVGARLIEAASVIRRRPMRIWPKAYGTIWPVYGADSVEAQEADQNRIVVRPSGAEIERADQALGWLMRYVGDDAETAKIIGHWANTTDDLHVQEMPAFVRNGLKVISRGLRADRVPVRV